MKIIKIEAGCEAIRLYTDADGAVVVREYVATVGPNPAREISCVETAAVDGVITLPRKENENDRIYSRFAV